MENSNGNGTAGQAVATVDASALTATERKSLATCEATIDRGRKAFVEVGRALIEVRDGKLYRDAHETFEGYCKDRWDFGRAYAYRLIGASECAEDLSPIGDILPTTESQARPLVQFTREDRPAVWQDVLNDADKGEDGQPIITARRVEHVVKRQLTCSKEKPYKNRRAAIRKKYKEASQKRFLTSMASQHPMELKADDLDGIKLDVLQELIALLNEIEEKKNEIKTRENRLCDLLDSVLPEKHPLNTLVSWSTGDHNLTKAKTFFSDEVDRREAVPDEEPDAELVEVEGAPA